MKTNDATPSPTPSTVAPASTGAVAMFTGFYSKPITVERLTQIREVSHDGTDYTWANVDMRHVVDHADALRAKVAELEKLNERAAQLLGERELQLAASEARVKEFEAAATAAAEKRHGASGMCCHLRLNNLKRAESAERQVKELEDALKEQRTRSDNIHRELAASEAKKLDKQVDGWQYEYGILKERFESAERALAAASKMANDRGGRIMELETLIENVWSLLKGESDSSDDEDDELIPFLDKTLADLRALDARATRERELLDEFVTAAEKAMFEMRHLYRQAGGEAKSIEHENPKQCVAAAWRGLKDAVAKAKKLSRPAPAPATSQDGMRDLQAAREEFRKGDISGMEFCKEVCRFLDSTPAATATAKDGTLPSYEDVKEWIRLHPHACLIYEFMDWLRTRAASTPERHDQAGKL